MDTRIVREWMIHNFADITSYREVADHFGVRPETLRKNFAAQEGQTLSQLLRDLKFEEARIILESGGSSCRELASSLKLGQPQNFSRAFKRRFGVTMTGYGEMKGRQKM